MEKWQSDGLLEEIVLGFERFCETPASRAVVDTSIIYDSALNEAPNEELRAHHISSFAEESRRFSRDDLEHRWGFYVSALASLCADGHIEISVDNFPVHPRNVGAYLARKRLTVIGNVGDNFGVALRSGKLLLRGNASDYVGRRVRGDSLGAEIVIQGDCGRGVADGMGGVSVIRLEGAYAGLGRPLSGEIYHQGHRIWPVQYGKGGKL